MRDVLSIVAGLALFALAVIWIMRLRSHGKRRSRSRSVESAESARALRDRLGTGRARD